MARQMLIAGIFCVLYVIQVQARSPPFIKDKSRGPLRTFAFLTEEKMVKIIKRTELDITKLDPAWQTVWERNKDSFYHITDDMRAMIRRKTFYADEADKLNNRAHRLIERVRHEGRSTSQKRALNMVMATPLNDFSYSTYLELYPYLNGLSSKPEMFQSQIRDDVLAMMYIASRYPVSDTDIPRNIARLKQLVEQTIQGLSTDDYSSIALNCLYSSFELMRAIMVGLEDILKKKNVDTMEEVLDHIGLHGIRIVRTMIHASDPSKDGYKSQLNL